MTTATATATDDRIVLRWSPPWLEEVDPSDLRRGDEIIVLDADGCEIVDGGYVHESGARVVSFRDTLRNGAAPPPA